MIVVLIDRKIDHSLLIAQLERQPLPVLVFYRAVDLQRWLELNTEPAGIVVDFSSSIFQDFLIRFTLRYPEIPILSVKEQPHEHLLLRLEAFKNRLNPAAEARCLGKVLLVDDSSSFRIHYQKLLENEGFKVELANCAASALEIALNDTFDLAIIDYFMPGENGAQLCRELHNHEETHDLVCAILTAEYKQTVVDDCLNAGARDCMFKNESGQLFLTRVKALLRNVDRKRQVEKERARLIGLLYSVAEGVFGVTADGRIQFVNPSTLKLLGYSMVDLLGRYPHDCIHPTDNIGRQTSFDHCFLQQAYLLGDELREWRTLFQRADGSFFPVECSLTSLGEGDNSQGSVVVFRDISEQLRLEKNWQWQLSHDAMTGLLNRSAFEDMLNSELNRIRRTEESGLLLFIDLDNFKIVNDRFGHAAGDELLVTLAKNLAERTRETDFVGRYAGDEFVVFLSAVTPEQLAELAENYRLLLQETRFVWEGQHHQITGSIGLSLVDQHADSIGELIAQADQACHQAKSKGRNQWSLYCKENEIQTEQGNWFARLTDAMKQQQFVLLKQPVFCANNPKQKVGDHCLLRLEENNNLISPALFMSNARRFGVIKDIDLSVIKQLAEFCKNTKVPAKCWFTLSISVDSLVDEQFKQQIVASWEMSGLSPERLRFDISEEQLYRYTDWQNHVEQLRSHGFGFIISHFGMNTQTTINLSKMPIDAIKLDSSLTRELTKNSARSYLLDAIIKTAQECNIQVIASHIESCQELNALLAKQVDMVQGFFLGRPERLVAVKMSDCELSEN